ncbi:hypothetical protein MKX67_09035 [Cytobacillus sp. FSL W7-1323]|uniref:hypothetical protein n=1 Tax=Cytobacillus sp. FSL W7-1323 TaxID=2921700 RepID=UPI0031580F39
MKPEDMYVSVTDEKGDKYYIFAQSQPVSVVGTSDNGGIKVEGDTIKTSVTESL